MADKIDFLEFARETLSKNTGVLVDIAESLRDLVGQNEDE